MLEFYSNNVTEVITALVEDNLHPSLADIPRIDPKPQQEMKTIIPNLYHKKAKQKIEEIGNRKEQIYINAIASQFKYVVEEDDDGIMEDDTGAKYSSKSKFTITNIFSKKKSIFSRVDFF